MPPAKVMGPEWAEGRGEGGLLAWGTGPAWGWASGVVGALGEVPACSQTCGQFMGCLVIGRRSDGPSPCCQMAPSR